jgi:hypothetical protein
MTRQEIKYTKVRMTFSIEIAAPTVVIGDKHQREADVWNEYNVRNI